MRSRKQREKQELKQCRDNGTKTRGRRQSGRPSAERCNEPSNARSPSWPPAGPAKIRQRRPSEASPKTGNGGSQLEASSFRTERPPTDGLIIGSEKTPPKQRSAAMIDDPPHSPVMPGLGRT